MNILFSAVGPSLQEWEKFKAAPHDRWWGNFIRTARVRIEELRNNTARLLLLPGWFTSLAMFAERCARTMLT